MRKRWRDWLRQKSRRLISVASRGPEDGNGGISSIATALKRRYPEIVFIHRGAIDGIPHVMVTRGGGKPTPDRERGRLDQNEVSEAKLGSQASGWFLLHHDYKNCTGYRELRTWNEVRLNPEIDDVVRQDVTEAAERVIENHRRRWAALCNVCRPIAEVIYYVWLEDPCPIFVNDPDNGPVIGRLIEIDPDLAEWIIYNHHVPVPAREEVEARAPFYLDYYDNILQAALANGIRAFNVHTPRHRMHVGHAFASMGHEFNAALMEVRHNDSGRTSRLGRTLAIVDRDFFCREGASGATNPIDIEGIIRRAIEQARKESRKSLVGDFLSSAWVNNLPFIVKTDRGDDPVKNGRRFVQALDKIFTDNHELRGTFYALIIGKPTRSGVFVYDSYLSKLEALIKEVNERHRKGNWVPIIWVDIVLPSAEIAAIYGHPNCQGVFVGSKKDGLHLGVIEWIFANLWKLLRLSLSATAEEVLALIDSVLQNKLPLPEIRDDEDEDKNSGKTRPAPGVAFLSEGAGSHEYLGHQGAISIKPNGRGAVDDAWIIARMAAAILAGLNLDPQVDMSPQTRRFRFKRLFMAASAEFDLGLVDTILEHVGLPLPEPDGLYLHNGNGDTPSNGNGDDAPARLQIEQKKPAVADQSVADAGE